LKKRLDEEIVKRQLVNSRTLAQKLILEGKVLLDGRVAIKPNEQVNDESNIQLIESQKYVSRGGFKLEFALKEFGVDVKGKLHLILVFQLVVLLTASCNLEQKGYMQ